MDQTNMEPQGARALKICGILMIIGGALGLLMGIIALVGIAVLSGDQVSIGGLVSAGVLVLLASVVELIAGIIGVKNCKNPAKATTCIVWGAVVAALSIISTIINVSSGGSFKFSSFVTGLIIPVVFIVGAVLNKKSAA